MVNLAELDAAVEARAQMRRSQPEARLAAGSSWRNPIPGLIFATGAGRVTVTVHEGASNHRL